MAKPRAIDVLAQQETRQFHQRQSVQFFNCAIELMCVDFEPDVVAAKLEAMAKHLREHQ